jgi:hypothetical protein
MEIKGVKMSHKPHHTLKENPYKKGKSVRIVLHVLAPARGVVHSLWPTHTFVTYMA